MGVRCVHVGFMSHDPPAEGLRHASRNGRQLWALARGCPGLVSPGPVTGVYQALGPEKHRVYAGTMDLVSEAGTFDVLRPAGIIFEHSPLGPLVQLAVTAEAVGPFHTLEGDGLAGGMALLTALEDLADGLCERALVGGYCWAPPCAWLMGLVAAPERETRWHAAFLHGRAKPDEEALATLATALGSRPTVHRGAHEADPLGLEAHAAMLEAAERGGAHAVWTREPDGRAMLLGVRHVEGG